MARIFLYIVAGVIGFILLGIAGLYVFWDDAQTIALRQMVPNHSYAESPIPPAPDYAQAESWAARPGADPYSARAPEGVLQQPPLPVDVFFIHPTSYLGKDHWNAPIDDPAAIRTLPRILTSQATPFAASARLFAPRYRQAAFGAFLAANGDTDKAISTAYRDIEAAFEHYIAHDNNGRPFIIAGHSQGALLGLRLLKNRIDKTPLADRLIAAYLPGWPFSLAHDAGALNDVHICRNKTDGGCLLSWQTFGETGEPAYLEAAYAVQKGLDGKIKGKSQKLCHNPVSWVQNGASDKSMHQGAVPPVLVPDTPLSAPVSKALAAQCRNDGFLYVSPEPGAPFTLFLLPGRNYHVYDIHLFSMDIRANARERAQVWLNNHNVSETSAGHK